MSQEIHAYAAASAGSRLEPFTYDPGPLGSDQVEIAVEYCGLCRSDLSVIQNDWGMGGFPIVPGHEVIGKIVKVGDHSQGVAAGQTVGVGWTASSCFHCRQCLSGDQHLCAERQATIVGRYGGFADSVRCHWGWAIPIPDGLDPAVAGPLLCGGVTVFSPLLHLGIRPTDHVGVIGIGGLGHMALRFADKWGCDVTAFTTSDSKAAEALSLGARHVVNTRDEAQLKRIAGSLDLIISTVNAPVNWSLYLDALAPHGRLHVVGVVPEPIPVPANSLIGAQRSVSGSPTGSPATLARMLDFCARHQITPITEAFPLSDVNEALARLKAGKAHYRIVLKNDIG